MIKKFANQQTFEYHIIFQIIKTIFGITNNGHMVCFHGGKNVNEKKMKFLGSRSK
jgi:hypothetical protein